MQLSTLLKPEMIKLDLIASDKEMVLKEMVGVLYQGGKIKSEDNFYDKVLAREAETTTGMGRGIAIPHGKSDEVKELSLALGICKEGMDFKSIDGQPVYIIFMVADFAGTSPEYLKLLSKISFLVRKDEFREALLTAETSQNALDIIKRYE
ncbi:fructose-specific phosphotransferase system IIA component [Orenia metallireducens]|jgi:PTS system fructose-specific IIC component|uniref:PTS sugar transporter subunit IIA n=1 Tax=Orenia metallireducens TaxID=1413210 RepID=UPI000D06F072|nr:PTS sugar transporter subunit IIA [Orenia metallireducens]PRX30375.1 fructose-specific phosphotransferase system IIA component [Orenia metallireducens]